MSTYIIYAILTDEKSGRVLNIFKRAECYNSGDAVIMAELLDKRERELVEQGARVGDCFNTCHGWKVKQGAWKNQKRAILEAGQKGGLHCIR